MTRAVFLSDSHGDLLSLRNCLDGIWHQSRKIDAVIFLGDGLSDFEAVEAWIRGKNSLCDIYAVRGNCDFGRNDIEAAKIIYLDATPVFITHGHLFSVKSGLAVLDDAAHDRGCDIALYGHTHTPAEDIGQTLMLNPGSVADGRIGLLEIDDNGKPHSRLLHFF